MPAWEDTMRPSRPAEPAPLPSARLSSWAAHRQLTRHASLSAFEHSYVASAQPVELQVETMSSISTRVFLYTWYTVLIVALVVESNVGLQWVSRNFCGDATVSAYHLEEWNSTACISWEAYWVLPKRAATTRVDGDDMFASKESDGTGRSVVAGKAGVGWSAWPPTGAVRVDGSADAITIQREEMQSAWSTGSSIIRHAAVAACSSADPSSAVHTPGPTMPPLRRVYKLRWTADALSGVMNRELNRFLHVFISLASPLSQTLSSAGAADQRGAFQLSRSGARAFKSSAPLSPPPPSPPSPQWKMYEVLVALEETSVAPSHRKNDASLHGGDNSGSNDGPGMHCSQRERTPSFSASSASSSSSSSGTHNDTTYTYTYTAQVTCWRGTPRCSTIVLPSNVVILSNNSRLTITLINVDAELAEATLRQAAVEAAAAGVHVEGEVDSLLLANTVARALRMDKLYTAACNVLHAKSPSTGVGVMYQRSSYTIGTIIFRYVFLFITVVSTLRFLYRSGQAPRMLYEQKWTLALQLGLLLYLNPLYWWCIYAGESARGKGSGGGSAAHSLSYLRFAAAEAPFHRRFTHVSLWRFALYYVEFHLPTYFVGLTVCYIWGVIAGSFRWSSAAPSTASAAPSADPSGTTAQVEATVLLAPTPGHTSNRNNNSNNSTSSNHNASTASAAVPLAVTVSGSQLARRRVRLLLIAFMLTVAALDTLKCFFEEESVTGAGEITCRTTRCLQVQRAIVYVLVGGIFSSGVGLYWLRRNLARHPYLSTRPQQLACRIIIFIYFTGGLYCVVQMLLLKTLYRQLLAILYYQPLVQLSHLFVLTSFVNHMTYVYTATQSSLQIPIRPSDPRWKTVGWSSRWYRWLDWHGGSLYVFFNEAEERRFYEVQVSYQLDKRERKEQRRRMKKQEKKKENERQAQQQSQQRRSGSNDEDGVGGGGGAAGATSAVPQERSAVTFQLAKESEKDGHTQEDSTNTMSACARLRDASRTLRSYPPHTLSVNTLSAMSEPEETDWLLLDSAGVSSQPNRPRRTSSTLTQASTASSKHNNAMGYHNGDHYEQHPSNNSGEEEDDEASHPLDSLTDRRGDDRGGNDSTGTQPTSWTDRRRNEVRGAGDNGGGEAEPLSPSMAASGISPFPLSMLPSAVVAAPTDSRHNQSGADIHGVTTTAAADDDHSHTSRRVLSRVSSRVLVALHGAESRLVDGTATFVDLLAEKCVDRPLQVLLRQRARQRFVFFNLETAIDCLNLSREAYAVQESKGDDLIRTGIQVDAGKVPRAALTLVERVVALLFGFCFKKSPLEPDTVAAVVEDSGRVEEADIGVDGGEREKGDGDSAGPTPVMVVDEVTDAVPRHSDRNAEEEEEGEGDRAALRRAVPARTPKKPTDGSADSAASGSPKKCPPDEKTPSTTPTKQLQPPQPLRSPTTSAPAAITPHMNINQYGYTPVAVFDTRGVQVVVARMDVSGSCPVHAGKVPRLTIAFRGTDNVANVLEDIRFQQRTWKEMETPTLLPRASVHSGFLELWMSLKAAVMDVVLKELRAQCAPPPPPPPAVVDLKGEEDKEEGERETRGDVPPACHHDGRLPQHQTDVFSSSVPFATQWTAPRTRTTQDSYQSNPLHHHGSGFMRVYVTGHSLGGALACLCAYSLRRMLLLIQYPEPDLVVYTYGQPRIGNSVFKQHYNRAVPCTFRVVNESDVVSGFNILGGHHVGVQVNVDRHGNYICKPMYIERLLRPTRGRGLALMNHKLAAYANSLNAVADVYANGACPVRCLESYFDQIESVSSSEDEEECGRPLQREERECLRSDP